MLLGAACVFSLRDSRLMQNKRASLNIQQEKLQTQHSIWSLLLCGTTSFHFSAPSLPSYTLISITCCIWSFFIRVYYSLLPCPFYISSSCIQNDGGKKGNILSTNCRQAFYLFIMKNIGHEVLKMKHIAFYQQRIKRIFPMYTPHSGSESLVLCNKTSEASRRTPVALERVSGGFK